MTVEVRLHFKFEGALASTGELDIYDASIATHGIARAMAITTHAFLNDGQPRLRAEGVQGAKILLAAPRRGSFEEVVRIVFDQNTLLGVFGLSVAGNAFWDFLKWSWGRVLGMDWDPETTALQRRADRIEPRLGNLADALEGPILDMHRPIKEGDAAALGVLRPRLGEVIRMDEQTLEYLDAAEGDQDDIEVTGNITRYNILSGYGRMFDDDHGATLSFRISDELPAEARANLTWSLDQENRGIRGKLRMVSNPTRNRRGGVVRHLIKEVRRLR